MVELGEWNGKVGRAGIRVPEIPELDVSPDHSYTPASTVRRFLAELWKANGVDPFFQDRPDPFPQELVVPQGEALPLVVLRTAYQPRDPSAVSQETHYGPSMLRRIGGYVTEGVREDRILTPSKEGLQWHVLFSQRYERRWNPNNEFFEGSDVTTFSYAGAEEEEARATQEAEGDASRARVLYNEAVKGRLQYIVSLMQDEEELWSIPGMYD